LVFEVGDDLLDDGVVAMLGLDHRQLVGAVGDKRKVAPVGPQLGLLADQAGAPGDQPPVGSAIASIASRMPFWMRTPIEYGQPAFSRRANTVTFQKPESARSSLTPLAPPRATRAISSSPKRSIPRCVFADPVRRRMCSTSRVSARVSRIG
jgi:hypothetical protein